MDCLNDKPGSRIWIGSLTRPYSFRSPFGGQSFVVLLNVVAKDVTPAEQAALSSELVTQGCRYAVCGGYQCSTWDDSVDMAFLATDPGFAPSDERFVITTWHEGEALSDIVEFFFANTRFRDYVPENFLALQVGEDEAAFRELKEAIEARASAGGPTTRCS